MDLNKLKGQSPRSDEEEGRSVINPLLASAYKKPDNAGSQDKGWRSQEDTEIECHLLRSRIPATQKGKKMLGAEGIHDGHAISSCAQATPSAATMKASPCGFSASTSTRLEPHQMSIVISEEGWEPAKTHRRKRPVSEARTVQTSNLPTDKSMGSEFFRRKLEGKCYNCFSLNHLARHCQYPPRCWKCYHSGHRAEVCTPTRRVRQHKRVEPHDRRHLTSIPKHSFPPIHHKTDHRSFAEVVRGQEAMAAARYPGDPRAKPARGFCAVSATGSIRRRRDELIDKAAVCWLNGNSHDTETYHLGDALRCQLNLHHNDFQVVKHFPEQYLVIFSDPAIRQRLVDQEILSDNGRDFHFAAWSERRYANNVNWEFRVKVRIEGIPVHCWAEDMAAKALGKSCSVHYVEEMTHRRERTRSFDLWAWCSDPSDIPTEVWLTVTEPDRELPPTSIPLPLAPPHHDDPVDLKRGHVYVLRNHLEVVEDLSFLQGRGRVGGPPNRKARREFIWSYGVPDTEGERLHGRRGNNRGRELRRHQRRDDDDYDDRRNHGMRRHRSLFGWARNARCRAGVEDCISSNRWRGRRDSPPRRSRAADGQQKPTLVWKVKAHKEEKKQKKVSFADPIATELKPPKIILPDDSIMLIKDQCTVQVEAKKQAVEMVDDSSPNIDSTAIDSKPIAALNPAGVEVEQHTPIKDTAVGLMLDQLQNFLHFDNPIDKSKMEAITVLIEQGTKKQKKGNIHKCVPVALGMVA